MGKRKRKPSTAVRAARSAQAKANWLIRTEAEAIIEQCFGPDWEENLRETCVLEPLMKLIREHRKLLADHAALQRRVADDAVHMAEPTTQSPPLEDTPEGRVATREQRQSVYGDPAINIGGTGHQWTAMIEQHFNTKLPGVLPASLVSLMMVAVKLNRLSRSPDHADSHHDAHVYLEIAKELAARGL